MELQLIRNSSFKTIASDFLRCYLRIKDKKHLKDIIKSIKKSEKNLVNYANNNLVYDFAYKYNDRFYIVHKYNVRFCFFELDLVEESKIADMLKEW